MNHLSGKLAVTDFQTPENILALETSCANSAQSLVFLRGSVYNVVRYFYCLKLSKCQQTALKMGCAQGAPLNCGLYNGMSLCFVNERACPSRDLLYTYSKFSCGIFYGALLNSEC